MPLRQVDRWHSARPGRPLAPLSQNRLMGESGAPGPANRASRMARYHGRMQGDHPSASGRNTYPHHRRTPCRTLQRARKALDAAHQKASQGRGKDVWWKSQKDDFPSTLANPANNAGFALYHRLYGYWMIYQSGHFTCSENRTFPLAKDTDGLATTGRNPEFGQKYHTKYRADRAYRQQREQPNSRPRTWAH